MAQQDEHEPGGMRMVLLVTVAPDQQITPEVAMRIRRAIGARLTAAHVPAVIAEVAELPVTFSGKLSEMAATAAVNGQAARNRQALRNPACLDVIARHPALRRKRAAPHKFADLPSDAPLESRLIAIWEELLDIAPIQPQDDYFLLGGDSLLAVTLMATIEEATGQQLPLTALLVTRTIEGLVGLLQAEAKRLTSNVIQIRHGEGRPIYFLPGLSGTVLEQHALFGRLTTPRPLYALQAPGVDGCQEPQARVQRIAALYIDAVRGVQPNGPYALVGYSFGGLVAYEMGCQLRAMGESIEQFVLLDTTIHPRFLPLRLRLRRRLRQIGLVHRAMRGRRTLAALRYLVRELRRRLDMLRLRRGATREVQLGDMVMLPPELQRVRAASGDAFIAYRPPRYDGTVLLLRAAERSPHEAEPSRMWDEIAARLEVEEISSTHFTLIEEPAVQRVAAALLRRLAAQPEHISA